MLLLIGSTTLSAAASEASSLFSAHKTPLTEMARAEAAEMDESVLHPASLPQSARSVVSQRSSLSHILIYYCSRHWPPPAPHSMPQRLASPRICRIPSSKKRKKMTRAVSGVSIQFPLLSVSLMRSSPFLAHLGPRKACCAASSSGRHQSGEPRAGTGWMSSLSYPRESSACSPSAKLGRPIRRARLGEVTGW